MAIARQATYLQLFIGAVGTNPQDDKHLNDLLRIVRAQFEPGKLRINDLYPCPMVDDEMMDDGTLVVDDRSGPAIVCNHLFNRHFYARGVGVLMKMGADPNTTDSGGHTALMPLASNQPEWDSTAARERAAKTLLGAGARTDMKTPTGSTVLHSASKQGDRRLVQTLLDHRADVSARDAEGFTPLHYGAMQCNMPVVNRLLNAGANAKALSTDGQTTLHCVASHKVADLASSTMKTKGLPELVAQLFINRDVDLRILFNGETAETIAKRCGHLELEETFKAEALHRARCEAFAMGHQERLGAGSSVRMLEAAGARLVLERVQRVR